MATVFYGDTIAVAIYYRTVILLYFRKEVQGMLRPRIHENKTVEAEEANPNVKSIIQSEIADKNYFMSLEPNVYCHLLNPTTIGQPSLKQFLSYYLHLCAITIS
jgi:hypothetical protein